MDDLATSNNPYLAIGVRPFINCCSVRTMHGGSLMLPQVRAAVAEASRHFVNLDELMEKAGQRIAELTGSEGALVTCGSAAAVALGTMACVAGNDPIKMLRLPDTTGMANRVVMAKNQRFAYDQAIRMSGTTIVEVETIEELDAAFREPVAMVCVLGTHEHESRVRMEDLVARAKPRGVPVMVDAASEHLQKPSPWFARGADLVIYSGGKFLRGPQTSGLLLGRKDLVEAAWRNASPHQALGRPMKVSKEDVIGVLTAVEYWIEHRDVGEEMARWSGQNAEIARLVEAVPGVRTEVVAPENVVVVPALRIVWDRTRIGIDGNGLRLAVLEGSPRIMLDDHSAKADRITIDPFQLQPGEAAEVGRAIARVLEGARITAPKPLAAPAVDLSGEWEVRVRFLHGERIHKVTLAQAGNALSGEQHSPLFEGAVTGQIEGGHVTLSFGTRYEGSNIRYNFEGEASAGAMSGTTKLGTSSDHHQGPVNLAQFGTARWSATRLG
jgi:D-glucosaminate-6-phosphate ammonia-lyase